MPAAFATPPAGSNDALDWLEDNAAGDVVLTPDGVLLEYNRAAAQMFRLPPEQDAHGMDVLSLCTDVPRFREAMRALELTGRLENWDCDFVRFDGLPLHAVINLIGNFDKDRALASVRAHLFNITEWRKLQQRSLDRERIDAIGRLAGGVAHDFNNLLMIIIGHTDLLLAQGGGDGQVARSAQAIHDAAMRASKVTKQLLAFGRRQVMRVQPVDLNDIAVSVQADIRRTFGRRVDVDLALERPLWPIRVDPQHFEQAIGTLIGHAIETMDQAGALTLRTRNVELRSDALSHRWMRPGSFVQLEIAHTGRPLDPVARARLFEPFDDGGAAQKMGLAAVYGAIKQSDGFVWIDQGQPDGTRYTILMPAMERRASAPPPVRDWRGHGETILLVDDEDDVRRIISHTLRSHGYAVVEAATAEEGARAFEAHRDVIEVLIADVGLTRQSGIDLATRLTAGAPNLRVLLMSGSPDHAGAVEAWKARGGFLDKPFTPHQLIERLTSLLRAE